MTKIPEFVYLVTTDTEWPVSVVVDDHPSTAKVVADVVRRRCESANVSRLEQVHVWKARLADVVEVDLIPAVVTGPALRERDLPSRSGGYPGEVTE